MARCKLQTTLCGPGTDQTWHRLVSTACTTVLTLSGVVQSPGATASHSFFLSTVLGAAGAGCGEQFKPVMRHVSVTCTRYSDVRPTPPGPTQSSAMVSTHTQYPGSTSLSQPAANASGKLSPKCLPASKGALPLVPTDQALPPAPCRPQTRCAPRVVPLAGV